MQRCFKDTTGLFSGVICIRRPRKDPRAAIKKKLTSTRCSNCPHEFECSSMYKPVRGLRQSAECSSPRRGRAHALGLSRLVKWPVRPWGLLRDREDGAEHDGAWAITPWLYRKRHGRLQKPAGPSWCAGALGIVIGPRCRSPDPAPDAHLVQSGPGTCSAF